MLDDFLADVDVTAIPVGPESCQPCGCDPAAGRVCEACTIL